MGARRELAHTPQYNLTFLEYGCSTKIYGLRYGWLCVGWYYKRTALWIHRLVQLQARFNLNVKIASRNDVEKYNTNFELEKLIKFNHCEL